MVLITKNIILYDGRGGVSGFAEFKIRSHKADIKVRHNLGPDLMQFSVMANGGAARVFKIAGTVASFEVFDWIDAEKEIFVLLDRGGETLASGVVNEGRISIIVDACEAPEIPRVARNDIKELDEILRKVCVIDENGKGQCESCPYREHFFGGALESGDEVVV